jgi:hypothetical protein
MITSLPALTPVPASRGENAIPPSLGTRRELLRQYKQSRPLAGVFKLTNLSTGRVYVGGSLHLDGAMNRMRFELKMRSHRNQVLQQDWIAHGAEAFRFEVLDQLKERDDPLFDYAGELACMLTLWRQEIPCHGDSGYNGGRP